MSGLLPHPGAVIYTTTKSAQIGMSEAMRCELEAQGVIVSVLCPGPVMSRIGEAGRNRQTNYEGSGYAPTSPAAAANEEQLAAIAEQMMDADEVGAMVREGIERDYLYILTHAEYGEGLDQRAAAICAALPDRPQSEYLKQMVSATMRNPALDAEIERRAGD
jgi:short-subunit dehydrogenase